MFPRQIKLYSINSSQFKFRVICDLNTFFILHQTIGQIKPLIRNLENWAKEGLTDTQKRDGLKHWNVEIKDKLPQKQKTLVIYLHRLGLHPILLPTYIIKNKEIS